MSERIERINALLQEHIGEIMQREVDYSQECLITITHVETSPDMKNATVFLSVLPDNKRGSALEALKRNSGRIKAVLFKRMHTKIVPNLRFAIDEQEVFAQGVEKVLSEIQKEEKSE